MMKMLLLAFFMLLSYTVVDCELPGATLKLSEPSTCTDEYKGQTPTHTLCLEPDPEHAGTIVPLTQEVKDEILAKHNELRSSVDPAAADMQKVVWDDKLERTAKVWAALCTVTAHDQNKREPGWPGIAVGQNRARQHINVGEGFAYSIERWYSEYEKYNAAGRKWVSGTGHYLQVVHSNANRIGCAEANCPTRFLSVYRICNYANGMSPGLPYTYGKFGSMCPNHLDSTGKLCECQGKLCFNGGKLNVSTCQCQCFGYWKGDNCNEFDCPLEDPSDCSWEVPKTCNTSRLPEACPIFCGKCPKPCNGKECLHFGRLNATSCYCTCNGYWEGDTCGTCLPNESRSCPYRSEGACQSEMQYMRRYMERYCPHKCGYCG